ncbi:hypothetical protein C8J57DRAFT_1396341 [Mycena rebaudengoi]|nr:hypothetical protein C8J57DRAFT_1396341 [Mycena rebaudengoi]
MSDALWNYVNAWWVEDPATRPPAKVIVWNIAMTKPSDHTNLIEYPSEPEQSQESNNLLDHFRTDPRAQVMLAPAVSTLTSAEGRFGKKPKSRHWLPYKRNSRPGTTRKPFPDVASMTAIPHSSLIFRDDPDRSPLRDWLPDLDDSQTPDAQRFELVEISETSPITLPGYDVRTKYGTCIDAQASIILPPDLPPNDAFLSSPSIPMSAGMPGSGCTFGLECGCVDCRTGQAAMDRGSMAHWWETYRDMQNIALPGHELAASTSTLTNGIEQFLGRGAALPAPPHNPKIPSDVGIDSMNITVYPTAAMETQELPTTPAPHEPSLSGTMPCNTYLPTYRSRRSFSDSSLPPPQAWYVG